MIKVEEWKRRILLFFIYRSSRKLDYRITNKDQVFDSFGSHKDFNMHTAWMELVRDGLLSHHAPYGSNHYTISFDKRSQIMTIIDNEETDSKSEMMQPDESEVQGLKYHFMEKGFRTYPEQSRYYYYTKEDDEDYWICLHKTKPSGKATRIILGSLKDADSRMAKIWNATLQAAKNAKGTPFARKRVEDIEPRACGNNRLPSKAAFDVLVYKKWLTKVAKGKKTLYKVAVLNKSIIEHDSICE